MLQYLQRLLFRSGERKGGGDGMACGNADSFACGRVRANESNMISL